MIKSNPSLVKRRVKRQRPHSASAVIRRSFRSVVAAFTSGVGSAESTGPSCPRRFAGCVVIAALLLVCMSASGMAPMHFLNPNRQISVQLLVQNVIDSDSSNVPYFFPQVVNLWPNDGQVQGLGETAKLLLASCTDEDPGNDPCRLLQLNDEEAAADADGDSPQQPERVGVVRVPGRIGQALEEAVRIIIVNQTKLSSSSAGARRDVEVVSTSWVEPEDNDNGQYSRIIRIATQPLLLDAVDLVLDASESKDRVTTDDVLCVARLLAQWHCHHSALATTLPTSETARERPNGLIAPVLTVSAQVLLTHPSDVRKRLAWYVNRKARDVTEKTINDWMSGISHRILERIDECSAMATQLQHQRPDQDLQVLVQKVIQQEAAVCSGSSESEGGGKSASLSSPLTTARCDARGDSQLVEIVEILLSVPDAHDLRRQDSASLCGRFPSIQFCQTLPTQQLQQLVEQRQ